MPTKYGGGLSTERGALLVCYLTGTKPLQVRHNVVENLLRQCDEKGAVSASALGLFAQGIRVRITSGPFAGQMGEVGKISGT